MPATRTKSPQKGDQLECELCGLSVVVDEACGCAEVHELICCAQPMRKVARAAKSKAAAKPKAKLKPKK
ncbi:MAG TPA: hypothetical protein VM221_09900 [Armatimonadota bacterium]|nr:hypothetical protein [Armatimonadota bacterium]